MTKERITNILKRMTFEFHKVVDINNTLVNSVLVEVQNNVTGSIHTVAFPYIMLEKWYANNVLKYDVVKNYILESMSDYHSEVELWK